MLIESQTAVSNQGGNGPRAPTHTRFCTITWVNGRGYVLRSELNRYKADLMAAVLSVAPRYLAAPDPDPLVPLKAVAAELGVGRRTIGRRIAESRSAS
jgi:hypothetical protein